VPGSYRTRRGEMAPVFRTILKNATQLCEAKFGTLWLPRAMLFVRCMQACRGFVKREEEPLVRSSSFR